MGILVVKHFIAHGQPLQPECQQLPRGHPAIVTGGRQETLRVSIPLEACPSLTNLFQSYQS